MNISKLPIINKIYKKINNKFNTLESQINNLSQENINLRIKLKRINNEKIIVVFVCHRPSVWGSLKTVYEAMKNDDLFETYIVTIPNKKQLPKLGLEHEVYESEGAEEFWKGDNVISGYNYQTKEWFDLSLLKPDYVFFQQPYNIAKPNMLKSNSVSKYAKICHVEYGFISQKGIGIDCLPSDFIKDTSFLFIMHSKQKEWYLQYFNEINACTKMVLTGFPRFDELKPYRNEREGFWKFQQPKKFRIIWTPRWCINENNCHFIDYKDKLLEYSQNNQDVEFMFRPHPQAFLNYVAEKVISKENLDDYCNKLTKQENTSIDTSVDFLKNFYSSDCLITDYSSVVVEYFLTGKPIIYCKNDNSTVDNEWPVKEGFYIVRNWNELVEVLNKLKNGNDPLYEKRQSIIHNDFYIPKEGAGVLIKDYIKKDFGY